MQQESALGECLWSILGWGHSPLLQEFYQELMASVASRITAAHWSGRSLSTGAADEILGEQGSPLKPCQQQFWSSLEISGSLEAQDTPLAHSIG